MIEKIITTVGTFLGLPVTQTTMDIVNVVVILGAIGLGIILALCAISIVFALIESAAHDIAARKDHR